MLKVGELFASIRLDDKDFNRGVDQAGSRFGGLVGGVTKGGLLIAGALVGVGAAAGGLAFKAGEMASDLNESVSKVKVVFGDLGESVVNSMDDAATSMGMSKQAAIEAAGTYGNLFAAMGIGADKNREMSTELVRLSADLASFNNMDPTQVLDALRSGLSGETEPLKRLGVNINQARLEAKALEMGLWDGESAIDAAAKAQATYALVLEDTALAQGDFARTSDGMANQQRILKATFEDTFAKLGQAVIPIIEKILPQLTGALQGVASWVEGNADAIGDGVAGTLATIGDVVGWLVDTVWPMLLDAFVFLAENVIPVVVEAIVFLVEEVIPTLAEVIGNVAEAVIPMLAAAFTFLVEEIIPALAEAFTWIAENVLPVLVAVFQAVQGWIVENWPAISAVIDQVAGAIGTAFGVIAEVITAVWPVIEAIATVLFPVVGTAASILLEAIDVAFKGIGGVFEVLGTVAKTVFDAITAVWDGAGDFFEGVGSSIGGAVKGAVNAIIGVINGFIGFINGIQIHIPEIGVGPVHTPAFDWWGLNLGTIPYLAAGARNFRGGLAIVGEQGPELVSLPRGADVFSNAASSDMLRGGGERHIHYHVTVNGDLEDVDDTEDVLKVLQRLSFLSGSAVNG